MLSSTSSLSPTVVELADLSPPPELAEPHGGERFHARGRKWVEKIERVAGLRPTDRILDVGCGPGRMAIALTPRLGDRGTYDGFDITPRDIAWCKSQIEPRWPNSRFRTHQSFDLVLATSVFTHMLPAAVSNYVRETARVLRPGGALSRNVLPPQ